MEMTEENGYTLAEDARFALESLGIREMFAGFGLRELALSAVGAALIWGGMLGLMVIGG